MASSARELPDPEVYALAERVERVLLMVDVVESVRLVEEDEADFVSRWLAFTEHVRLAILPPCEGRLVKGLGDGLLLEFGDVRSAVSAAFAIQHAAHSWNVGRPAGRRTLLRVAIERSDVFVDRDDVYGRGVNRAARLLTVAGPGETVISAQVRDRLTADLDADVEDLGECYLKHMPLPVRVYRVGPPGPQPVIEPGLSREIPLPSLAVIPFATRDRDDEHHVLGEVLAEELIRDLSRSSELNVISRLSTTVFRGRDSSLSRICANLQADYVLSGEYRIDGQKVVADAELAEAKSGQIVWSRRFRGAIAGILSGRRELIDEMATDVCASVMSRELLRTQSQPLPTLKGYSLLIGGIAMMHRLSTSDFEQSRRLLEALIERTPRQAVPQAWLANWHVMRVQQGWSPDPQEDASRALQCTRRALDADSQCSLALAVDGFVHTNLLKRLDIARERYDLALRSNPSDALAWALKGTLHAFSGEGQQAVDCTRRALKLSPLGPQRYFFDSLAAGAAIASRDYEAARVLAKRSLKSNRNHASTLRILSVAQWEVGQHEAARDTARNLLELDPSLTVAGWLSRSPSAPFPVGQHFASVLRLVGIPG